MASCSLTLVSAVLLMSGNCFAVDEVSYLREFGYLTTSGAESQLTAEAVNSALKRFQRMFGLPQTGVLDESTSALMAKPRCGVKDEPILKRRRRTLSHPKWKLNKFTFLVTSWSRRLPAGVVDDVMSRAFNEWEKHANLEFRRAQEPIFELKFGSHAGVLISVKSSILGRMTDECLWSGHLCGNRVCLVRLADIDVFDIAFPDKSDTNLKIVREGGLALKVGSHHCEYPFSSTVLAHAFRPRGASFEPDEDPTRVIGDIHFNDDVPWNPPLLLATSIHEIGHALGLPHVGDMNSIMYPILVEGQQFTPQDVYLIQSLYGRPTRREDNTVTDEEGDTKHDEEVEKEEDSTTEPQPCTSGADAITPYRGEFLVFKNRWMWRVVNDGKEIYGPNLISDIFPDLPEKIDAAVEINDEIWIFAGNQYWIFSDRSLVDGPRPLSNLGIPESLPRLRLAYQWHYFDPPAVYLWADHDYWKLDMKHRRVEHSYARLISLNWKHAPQGATAAFSRNKELYFIQADQVYRMNTTDYRLPVAKGYPIPISKFWSFCERQEQSARLTASQANPSSAFCFLSVVLVFLSFCLS